MNTDELRKLAEAVIGAPEMKSYVWPTASNEITVWLGEEEAAFIAEADPAAVIALLDRIEDLEEEATAQCDRRSELAVRCGALQAEVDRLTRMVQITDERRQQRETQRDEARAAVKRLAEALFDLLHGCSVDAPKTADAALADPVGRRIVEGE
jgi:hypothetical protein